MIKGSCDFMERSPSLYLTTISGLVAIDIVVLEIKMFLIYNVTLHDHVFKGLYDLMG